MCGGALLFGVGVEAMLVALKAAMACWSSPVL